jgi:FkbH-like protein
MLAPSRQSETALRFAISCCGNQSRVPAPAAERRGGPSLHSHQCAPPGPSTPMVESLASGEISARRRRGVALLERPPSPEGARAAVLSTFNVDLLPPLLAEALERAGLDVAGVSVAGFGQIAQELLPEDSSLYRSAPDVLVLVLAVEDLLGPLFARAPSQLKAGVAAALVADRLEELRGWLALALERLPACTCCVALTGPVAAPLEQILAPLAPERGQEAVTRLREGVLALDGLGGRVIALDWDWHTRMLGTATLHDPRLWYVARMRLSQCGLATLAELLARHLAASRGAACKVVVVDLDGVLWGGVVGEAGLSGIQLGEEGIGLAFQDFQRELLRLRDLGTLLAICSKNNPPDATEVFERHPAMVLRREHFASERINWQDKASNLRELAAELNLGLESFLFLDDSPHERDWVRRVLAQVAVPELPRDPAERPAMLRATPSLQRRTLTDADRGRAAAYTAERDRRVSAASAASFEEFLASLEQEVAIEPVSEASLARAAQLCQRTNQFNLTTRRHTAAELESMRGEEGVELYTLSVTDRFGDSGITGLAILRFGEEEAEIDTLLMSCRILGRRLEDTLLAFLAERAAARGVHLLVGRYKPTAKNGQVADFYAARGFARARDGSFRLDLAVRRPASPPETRVRIAADA